MQFFLVEKYKEGGWHLKGETSGEDASGDFQRLSLRHDERTICATSSSMPDGLIEKRIGYAYPGFGVANPKELLEGRQEKLKGMGWTLAPFDEGTK